MLQVRQVQRNPASEKTPTTTSVPVCPAPPAENQGGVACTDPPGGGRYRQRRCQNAFTFDEEAFRWRNLVEVAATNVCQRRMEVGETRRRRYFVGRLHGRSNVPRLSRDFNGVGSRKSQGFRLHPTGLFRSGRGGRGRVGGGDFASFRRR